MDVLRATCQVTLEEELAKNPQLNRQMIETLQSWLKTQPHLPPVLDIQLVLFLLMCNHSVEKAKKLIDTHYTMRTNFEQFRGRDVLSEKVQDHLDMINLGTLKGLDHAGRRVSWVSFKTADPARYHGPTAIKLLYMYEDLRNYRLGGHAAGTTLVLDAAGFGLRHLTSFSISFLRECIQYFVHGANVPICSIIVINANIFAEKLVTLIRPFTPSDIMKRIQVLPRDKTDKLFNSMSRAIVPSDYGGEFDSMAQLGKESSQILLDNREFFLAEEKVQRIKVTRPADGMLRSDAFRKLELD